MNNVMMTLTKVSMLFLPLNFAVGFFGMNFFGANIEVGELGVPHGFLFGLLVAVMLAAPWGMWAYSRWRGWF
jgi:magnesium transporter